MKQITGVSEQTLSSEPDFEAPLVYITSSKTILAYAGSAYEDGWLTKIRLDATLDDSNGDSLVVGTLLAYRSNMDICAEDGHTLFESFEQHSNDLTLMALSIVNHDGEWRPFLRDQFSLSDSDVLYIDRLRVSPILRGRKLGLALVERCISLESNGCGLVVLDPFPEQYYGSVQPRIQLSDDIRRITRYFSKLGFKKIRGSRFLGYDPSNRGVSHEKIGLTDAAFDRNWDPRLLVALREQPPPIVTPQGLKDIEMDAKEVETSARNENIRSLLQNGENSRVEFKESIFWDMREDKYNSIMRDEVLKEICAFLNSDGGSVFCGVDDNGNITGLAKDLRHFGGSTDRLGLSLTSAISDLVKPHPVELVKFEFHEIDAKVILRLDIASDKTVHYQSPSTKREHAGKNIPRTYVRVHGSAKTLEGQDLLNWWSRRKTG